MNVNGVDNNNNRAKTYIKPALAAGTVCAGIKALFLSPEEKAWFRLALTPKDAFMKNAANELKSPEIASRFAEMMKNPEIASHCAQNGITDAKGLYENVFDSLKSGAKEISKQTLKNIGKTFVLITGAIFAGNLISDAIASHRAKAANKAEKTN